MGFALADFDIILGIDWEDHALETYKLNFPDAKVVCGDISVADPAALMAELGLEEGELDCLIGGPPCQGFSKNVPARNRFLEDDRNQLVREFLRFVSVFKPKTVLMENVAEMAAAYENAYSQEIEEKLSAWGYQVDWKRLLAADYGVPQMRRRAFFMANRIGQPIRFPQPTHRPLGTSSSIHQGMPTYVTVWEAISDLLPLEHGKGQDPSPYKCEPKTVYQELIRSRTNGVVHDHVARKLQPVQYERVSSLKEGQGIKDLPDHLRPASGYSGAYGRLWRDELAPTITCWVFHPGSGRFSHPVDNRVITIREAARLQSFPDHFVFKGSYNQKAKQVGNAVPPFLARALAYQIRECLESPSSHEKRDLPQIQFQMSLFD